MKIFVGVKQLLERNLYGAIEKKLPNESLYLTEIPSRSIPGGDFGCYYTGLMDMYIDFDTLPRYVEITDVTLRDGLQNEPTNIGTEDKIDIIRDIIGAGVKSLEVTSFVRPDLVPQLADAEKLVSLLPETPDCLYRVLVPNLKGYEKALKVGCKTVVIFVSATEKHNRENLGRSVVQTLKAYEQVLERAHKDKVKVMGAISMAFERDSEKLEDIIEFFIKKKLQDFILCDTSGTANPRLVSERLERIREHLDKARVILHFHDTTGCAIANVLVSLASGFTRFDASIGGIGGCPFAEGAAGNISMEDLVWFLDSLNIHTGIDIKELVRINSKLSGLLKRPLNDSRVSRYFQSSRGSCLR